MKGCAPLHKQTNHPHQIVFQMGRGRGVVAASNIPCAHLHHRPTQGRGRTPEKGPVRPVSEIAVTPRFLSCPPWSATWSGCKDFTGARPGEILQLRAADLDMSGPVWESRPGRTRTNTMTASESFSLVRRRK